MNKEFQVL